MTAQSASGHTDVERLAIYARRVRALERLLMAYRAHGRPSEAVHLELQRTGRFIDHDGQWRADLRPTE